MPRSTADGPAPASTPRPAGAPRVMVSSTGRGLEEHRMAVREALIQSELFPVMMEDDWPHDGTVLKSSLDMVEQAVAYIGIVGHLYGQVPASRLNPDGLSLTELEFDTAQRLGLPMLIFIMSEDHLIKLAHVEPDSDKKRRLTAFREKIKRAADGSLERVYANFDNLRTFELKAVYAINDLRRRLDSPSVVEAAPPDGARDLPADVPPQRVTSPTGFRSDGDQAKRTSNGSAATEPDRSGRERLKASATASARGSVGYLGTWTHSAGIVAILVALVVAVLAVGVPFTSSLLLLEIPAYGIGAGAWFMAGRFLGRSSGPRDRRGDAR